MVRVAVAQNVSTGRHTVTLFLSHSVTMPSDMIFKLNNSSLDNCDNFFTFGFKIQI
jgi:hypothetical protein